MTFRSPTPGSRIRRWPDGAMKNPSKEKITPKPIILDFRGKDFAMRVLSLLCAICWLLAGCHTTERDSLHVTDPPRPNYPAHWWTPVPKEGAPGWEILPQEAGPGE